MSKRITEMNENDRNKLVFYDDDADLDDDLGDGDDEMGELAMGMNFMQAQPAAAQNSRVDVDVDDLAMDMGAVSVENPEEMNKRRKKQMMDKVSGLSNDDLEGRVISLLIQEAQKPPAVGRDFDSNAGGYYLRKWYLFFDIICIIML